MAAVSDLLDTVPDLEIESDRSSSGSSTSSEAMDHDEVADEQKIQGPLKRTETVMSMEESIHFEADLLGAVGDIESDDSGSGSSTSTPPPDGDSVVDLEALDQDVLGMFGDIESDDSSASSEGQEAAKREALERHRIEEAEAERMRPKMAKKRTVFDRLLKRDGDAVEDDEDDGHRVEAEEESSSDSESYSFLEHSESSS